MSSRVKFLAAAAIAAGLAGSAAHAAPMCTSTINLGSSGKGNVALSSLSSGTCIASADKIYGNFNLSSLPSDTVLNFNMNKVGSIWHQQLSFNAGYETSATYNWGYEVTVNPAGIAAKTVITSMDADFTQTTGGPSRLQKWTNPMGSGPIDETKIGAFVQPGSILMTTYGPHVTDLIVTEMLTDAGTISSVTNTVTEFVPGHNTVPEPATLALLGAGLAGMSWARAKRRKA